MGLEPLRTFATDRRLEGELKPQRTSATDRRLDGGLEPQRTSATDRRLNGGLEPQRTSATDRPLERDWNHKGRLQRTDLLRGTGTTKDVCNGGFRFPWLDLKFHHLKSGNQLF